ncbi:MAG TPA: methyltransferase domain-containing protein [Planctomycetia bacterium]|nr:methyltransferase domain-containing protein [Planctomycetia bacterium]
MFSFLRKRRLPAAIAQRIEPPVPPSPVVAAAPPAKPSIPSAGYAPSPVPVPHVDALADDDLSELNAMLDWNCFTVDSRGRRFGNLAWSGKRADPQEIPDRRIVMFDKRFGLAGKTVLEVGCFEGVHTIALCQRAGSVKAVDSRISNVVKTLVRANFHGQRPIVFVHDLESEPADPAPLAADLMHHVGVLYHLSDPVAHVLGIGRYIRQGIMLDTHVAEESSCNAEYESCGRRVRYQRFHEGGKREAFSGMLDHAKWITLETLEGLLRDAGFPNVETVERRAERNGPRVLIFASK